MKIRGDKAATDGVDHILMQRLQAQQLAALAFQFKSGLAELGGERAGQMGDG